MTGGYLRTNWRQTSNALNTDALAGEFGNSSMFGGSVASAGASGISRPYPLVFFSMSGIGSTNANGIPVGAYSVMSFYFGESQAAAMGTGYKILPIEIEHRLLTLSLSIESMLGNLWFSICTSDDSVITFAARGGSISNVSFSAGFQFAGFIVSTP